MTDYNRFIDLFVIYLNEYNGQDKKLRKESFVKFIHGIENLRCDDFRYYYFMAYYKYKYENAKEAKEYIDSALNLIPQIRCDEKALMGMENGVFVIRNGMHIPVPNLHYQFGQVYFLAGEIYAVNGFAKDAIRAYQKSQYYKLFLKSEFEDEKNVSVYSFRKVNQYTLADLISDEITVSSSLNMNDPFDSIINLWGKDMLLNNCREHEHIDPLKKSWETFKIRSFATDNDDNSTVRNLLMWSHYADEHKGICVRYNLSRHFIKQEENKKNTHMYLKKVEYRTKPLNIEEYPQTIDSTLAFATKSIDWKYENEVRLIVYNPNRHDMHYGITMDSESYVDAIYFGYRCPNSDIKTISNIFKAKGKQLPKFYKMELDWYNVYKMKSSKQ